LGDFLDFVADALQLVDLDHRQHHPQVDRRGLPFGDDLAALLIQVDLHLIDRQFVGGDRIDEIDVGRLERRDGSRDLRLDQAAHRQHAGAYAFHLDVELLGSMFVHAWIPW
jgi:hypothetical protein